MRFFFSSAVQHFFLFKYVDIRKHNTCAEQNRIIERKEKMI